MNNSYTPEPLTITRKITNRAEHPPATAGRNIAVVGRIGGCGGTGNGAGDIGSTEPEHLLACFAYTPNNVFHLFFLQQCAGVSVFFQHGSARFYLFKNREKLLVNNSQNGTTGYNSNTRRSVRNNWVAGNLPKCGR